ncbi:MAG: sensor histidine kinase [Spirochaetales bacterium]|nr:sensor histidine kinase [Spirochaetales bacterium]
MKFIESFLSQCQEGLIILNEDFSVKETNHAIAIISGFSETEIKDSNVENLFDTATAKQIIEKYENLTESDCPKKIIGNLKQKNGNKLSVGINVNLTFDNGVIYKWLMVNNKERLTFGTISKSFPFDFWINTPERRTWMQNPYSKALWGDVKGKTPSEVGAGEEITKRWLASNDRALNGEVVESEIEYFINGHKKIYRNIVAPVKHNDDILGVLGVNIDISDLKQSLSYRDMLIKEVYHRVKNNLQMISSIVRLEAGRSYIDEDTRKVFDDIIYRIDAVSLIHERLYKIDAKTGLSLDCYLKDLVEYIVSGMNAEELELIFRLEEVYTDPDVMIAVGIIVTELVTNALKYARTEEEVSRLEIVLKRKDEKNVVINVTDNGPGLPQDFETKELKSIGFTLVMALVEQLSGSIEWNSEHNGTTFTFDFPVGELTMKHNK